MVLAPPLMIMLMGLTPKCGFSKIIYDIRMTPEQRAALAAAVTKSLPNERKGSLNENLKPIIVTGKQLNEAAVNHNDRAFWESTKDPVRAKIAGQYISDSRYNNKFRLTRMKMTCCANDLTPVVVTVLGAVDNSWKDLEWLRPGHFSRRRERNDRQDHLVSDRAHAIGRENRSQTVN
jgi:hypothetical protein